MKRAKLRRLEILKLVQILMAKICQYEKEVKENELMNKDEKEKIRLFNLAGYTILEELEMLIINNIHPDEITIAEMRDTKMKEKFGNRG